MNSKSEYFLRFSLKFYLLGYPTRAKRYKKLFENIGINKNEAKVSESNDKSAWDRSNRSGKKSSKRIKIRINPFPISKRISPSDKPGIKPVKSNHSSIRRMIKNNSKTISQNSNLSIRTTSKVNKTWNRTLSVTPYEDHDNSSKSSLKYKNNIIDSLIKKKVDENTIVSSTNSLASRVSKNRSKTTISRPNSNNDFINPKPQVPDTKNVAMLNKTTRHKAINIRWKLQKKSKRFNNSIMNKAIPAVPLNDSWKLAYQDNKDDSKPWSYFGKQKKYGFDDLYSWVKLLK